MKSNNEYKIIPANLDQALPITQNLCNKTSKCMKLLFGENLQNIILPRNRNYLYDYEILNFFYVSTSLDFLKNCKGFKTHMNEYRNNFTTTSFVTLVADILLSHGLQVELEPNIINHNKKPDIYAIQQTSQLGIYFECKAPQGIGAEKLLSKQQKIFDSIKDIISNNYSLAFFYEKDLNDSDLKALRNSLIKNLKVDEKIFENRVLVENRDLNYKLIVSGIIKNPSNENNCTVTGLPVFDHTGFSYVNGINRYGKNILFYKKTRKSSFLKIISNQAKDKVPKNTPYIVFIDFSGIRFNEKECKKYLLNSFKGGNNKSVSGVVFLKKNYSISGDLLIDMKYISNPLADIKLEWFNNFLIKSLCLKMNSRL